MFTFVYWVFYVYITYFILLYQMNGINLFIKKYIIYILTVIKYRTYIF